MFRDGNIADFPDCKKYFKKNEIFIKGILKNIVERFRKFSFGPKLQWEYLPPYIANIPVVLFWLFFAIKSRRIFFFTVVNPAIKTGGMLGSSKFKILCRLPQIYIPTTILIKKNTPFEKVEEELVKAGINFPAVAKPDVGERGFLVCKIDDFDELKKYRKKNDINFIIQEYVDYPVELSVMYHRIPGNDRGKITSVCQKRFLTIKGDGHSTIRELMSNITRAKLQIQRLEGILNEKMNEIPKKDEDILLEPIGNHSRGTAFLNGNHLIDEKMNVVFDKIGHQMEGVFYGRFDLRCTSVEDLKEGKNIKVVEFNGVASEPAHVYDPTYPVFKKYKDFFYHWKIIYEISKIQVKKGIHSIPLTEGTRLLIEHFRYLRNNRG